MVAEGSASVAKRLKKAVRALIRPFSPAAASGSRRAPSSTEAAKYAALLVRLEK
ncbi:hypothetical protein D3C81_2134080 [compost metagenome]